ncbi:MAG: hypothetical protein KDD47_22255, partial [Acidobacteria bacterium]|nr:hypothetical protein [Acidobacteriota bacterium]
DESSLRREPKARAELAKAASALRTAVESGQTYLVTPIKDLEMKLAEWYLAPEDGAARRRRRQLDELLLELVRLRHRALEPLVPAQLVPELEEEAAALAQTYVSDPTLHVPRLSQLLLEPFLAAEAAAVRPAKGRAPSPPAELLETVAREVRSGRFDPEESVRRLRSLEAQGLFVHSLVYRLLKMAATDLLEAR